MRKQASHPVEVGGVGENRKMITKNKHPIVFHNIQTQVQLNCSCSVASQQKSDTAVAPSVGRQSLGPII